jgi:hypothetical protein
MSAQDDRLLLLGRAMLAEAGYTNSTIAKAHRRAGEALDATKQKVLQHEGVIVLGPEQVDFTERREAAALVLKLADHFPTHVEHEITGEVGLNILGFGAGV